MNTRNAQSQQQGNTMMVKELAQAKAQVKKLEADLAALKGKPAEAPKAQAPAPKTRDLVLASNKALRDAVALLKRTDALMRESFAPLYVQETVDRNPTDKTFVLLVKDIPAFLALDLDKTVSAAPVQAKVVRRPEVVVVGKPPMAGIQKATVQPTGAPPVVK